MKVVATNRKAYHDYFVLETYEAGIVLQGSEVKSVRLGNVNLKDSYVTFSRDGEVFVKNMFVKSLFWFSVVVIFVSLSYILPSIFKSGTGSFAVIRDAPHSIKK